MTNIKQLTCKRFYIPIGSGEELYCIQIIAQYMTSNNSMRVVSRTYHNERDIPYTFKDYMSAENQKEVKWIDQRDSIFRVLSSTYREDDS